MRRGQRHETTLVFMIVLFAFAASFATIPNVHAQAPKAARHLAIRGVYGGVPVEILDRGASLKDYGINAVWIGSDGLTKAAIDRLHAQGAKVFAEFNTMHASGYLKDHPDAAPIGIDGNPCPPPDGWQGVCPTHPGYRAWRMDAFRKALATHEIDGIWLDYHHAHASWEQAEPNMPETCFCPRCVNQFAREAKVQLPNASPAEIAHAVLSAHKEKWVDWRCGVFTGWVREFRDIRNKTRPKALLGTFHCPWTANERDGAIRNRLAIDLKAQAPYIDVFSPMPYHARFGHANDPAWVERTVTALGEHLGIKGIEGEPKQIWPIVQLTEWGEPVPLEQVAEVIHHGARAPATGMTIFVWGPLSKDRAKLERVGELYRSLQP